MRHLALIMALTGLVCATPKEASMIRQPAVAGQFYDADPKALAANIDSMLKEAEVPVLSGRVVALQVPHAGYPFSGPTAACGFKLLKGMDSLTVVMVGPSHSARVDRAAVYGRGAWKTPLGEVKIDEELARLLIKEEPFFAELPQAHAHEHSLEVQVPFLQRSLKSFKIVPIMLLWPSYEQCERVGKAIARAAKGRKVVVLASSDLYHGYSYEELKATDSVTLGLIAQFDPRGLYEALRSEKAQACGGFPIVAVMIAAKELGADNAVILHQTNSADVTHTRGGWTVGYSAVAFLDSEAEKSEQPPVQESEELTKAEQQSLLEIARKTLESYIRTGTAPKVEPLTPRLAEKRGVFVTLHKHGELRGCIGYPEAVKPLYQAVADMAISSSTEDPRFPPVQPEELDDIDIEITVLSPLRRIYSPESVIVGRHGLVIRKGFYSGLLLPQVPVEQGWSRQQFLEHICLKAGLPPGSWKEKDAQLFVFTGQVFGEKRP
ncbi:MAG: AmmeMemoRadiSam system protein B [candidate division WOR-3 bacterium]